MDIVLTIHSIVRWLILIVAVLAVVRFGWGWRRGGEFRGLDRGLLAAFSGLIDLQVLLGLVYFFWNGLGTGAGFPGYRIEHLVTMLIAAIFAHLPARWKAAEDRLRFRHALIGVLDALVIILIGVARLPGGWTR
jgi:hypothetical protein